MTERPARRLEGALRTDARATAVLVVGCLLLYLPLLGAGDLRESNDARYAEVAREMAEGGDLLVPRLHGEVYSDKPPLYFWLAVASGAALGGISEFAARLPSALAATALVLVTFALGRRLFGRRAAFFGATVLATNLLLLERAIHATLDPLLALCVTGAIAVYEGNRGEGWGEKPFGGSLAFGGLCGLATLTKGPVVGLLLPAAVVGAERWVRLRWRSLRLDAVLLVLVPAILLPLAWFLPASLRSDWGLTLDESIGRQSLGRVLAPWNHEQPPWYFLLAFPVDFLPWTPFLLLALPALRRPADQDRDGVRFAATWFLVTLAFFSLGPSKRHVYLLPAFPAVSLLVGLAIARAGEGGIFARPWARAASVFGPGLCALGLATALASPLLPRFDADARPWWGLFVASLLCVGGLALSEAYRRRGLAAFFLALPLVFGSTALGAGLVLLPELDAVKSARPISDRIRALAPSEPVLFLDVRPDAYSFYTRMQVRETEREEEFLGRLATDSKAAGVTTRKWSERLRPDLAKGVEILAEDRVGRRRVVLLGRRGP